MDYNPNSFAHRAALATDIKATLVGLGFQHKVIPGVNEMVFVKPSARLKGVEMRVFTSIVGDEVREVGGDSIKVCAIFVDKEGKNRGMIKERRIHRTGQLEKIAARVKDRIKDAAKDLNETKTCSCGSPTGKSKAGNTYCLAVCWK